LKKESLIIMVGLGIILSLAYAQGNIAVPEPVQKIFRTSCSVTGCHQGKYPAMNMSFEPDKIIESTINVPSKEKPDLKIINTAEAAKSYLSMKIRGDKDIAGKRMPLNATPLKDADIQSIQNWINSLKGTPAAALVTQGPAENGQKKKFEDPAFWGTQVINLPTAQMIEIGFNIFRAF
jgi:monoamine oxidase